METWPGARNLADLGGLPTVAGATTATGRIWRSAASEWMTAAGWSAARGAGLTTVVDLRNDFERGRGPQHPEVPAGALAGVEVVSTPTEDPDDPEYLVECGPWLDHPNAWAPTCRRYPERLRAVFEAIDAAPGGVLVHCAGGRDRTGLVGSMLLRLADVTPEAIAANYADGFRGAGEHRGHGFGYDPVAGEWVEEPDREWAADELDAAVAARVPVVVEWATTHDVRGYLAGAGLADEAIDRLSRRLRG